MTRNDWMDIFVKHVVDNSDANRAEAEDMAEQEADHQQDEYGIDPEDWDHPETASLAVMGDWEHDQDEEE